MHGHHTSHITCFSYRFESTIVGQFFGHAHSDSYKVFYADEDNNSERPIG